MPLNRSGWALTGLALASIWALGPQANESLTALRASSFPDVVLAVGTLMQLTLSAWVVLTALLGLVAGPSRLLRLLTPRLLRNALFVGTAGALALAPAHADQSVDGLRLPDRPSGVERHVPAQHASAPLPPPTHIVVQRGDTLWGLARTSLPADASTSAIARATVRWHRTNRAVIGPSPDLIFPGQQLTPPAGKDRP